VSATTLHGRRLVVAFTALLFVNTMSGVDSTIVATAAPTITADLGRLALLPWLSSAYLLAQIGTIPLYGALGDRFGRKRVLLAAAALFLLASMLCGLAQSMPQLVASRALQGAGAGGLAGLTMALVADIAPPAKLGRYLGYAGLVFALTFIVGPLTGGLFVDHLSWRWAFFINLPAGLLGGAFVLALVPSARASAARTIDFAGIALLAATTTTMVLATSWGGVEYAWDSPVMVFLVAVALVAAIGFVAWERRAPNPLIPLAVVRDRTIALAIVSNFISGCGFTTAIVFLPVMFQAVAGMNATESGALLIPLGLGTALTTAAVGRIVEHAGGAKAIPALGMLLAIGAYAVLGTITVDSTAAYAATAGVFLGIGVGCVFQTMLFIVQRSVTIVHLGIVSSTVMLARLFGSALGVALFGSIFNNHLDGSFTGLLDLDLASLRGDPETIAALEPALRHDVSEAFADALAAGFRVFVVVMFVGLVSVVLQRASVIRSRITAPVTDLAGVPTVVPQ
jgi:EmrB/QacA subfamily drug resistance transporter